MSGSFICVKCGFVRCMSCAKEIERTICIECGWLKKDNDEMIINRRDCGHYFCQICNESVKAISCPYDIGLISTHKNFLESDSCTHHLLTKICDQANCSFCQKNSKPLWSCLKCKKVFCLHFVRFLFLQKWKSLCCAVIFRLSLCACDNGSQQLNVYTQKPLLVTVRDTI